MRGHVTFWKQYKALAGHLGLREKEVDTLPAETSVTEAQGTWSFRKELRALRNSEEPMEQGQRGGGGDRRRLKSINPREGGN